MKTFRILVFAILVIIIVVAVQLQIGRTKAYNNKIHVVDVHDCIQENEPLEENFPELGSISTCYWDTDVVSKAPFLDIGPHDFWINGYMVIDKNDVARLLKEYVWFPVDTELDWQPIGGSEREHFSLIQDQITDHKSDFSWIKSVQLNELNQSRGYYGEIYMDPYNYIIMFDLIES